MKQDISKLIDDHFGEDLPGHSYKNVSYSTFHGYPPLHDLLVLFQEHPEEFANLFDLTQEEPDPNAPRPDRYDYIREHVAHDVANQQEAENVALMAELQDDPDVPFNERMKVLAEEFSAFDQFRRMAAVSKLILEKGYDITLLDRFEAAAPELFRDNEDYILFEKSTLLEVEALKVEAFQLKTEIIAKESERRDLLER